MHKYLDKKLSVIFMTALEDNLVNLDISKKKYYKKICTIINEY
jgi:hypothetical protein